MDSIYLPDKNSKKEPRPHKLVDLGPEATAILEELRSQTSLSYTKIAETLIRAAYPHVQFVERKVYQKHVRGEQHKCKSNV